jgi:aldehyde:ferredoxin oxidoreductase
MFGWTGIIIRINLSSQKVEKQPLEENLRLNFLGGRGINSRFLYQEVPPELDPLTPENTIILGSSPLSGTSAPSSPRCTITAKSPLTGILGDASFGGYFAPEMKKAGYDHLIIQGASEKPVYLLITEDGAVFKDASHLWGKTTWETEELIQKELKDPKVQVLSIGPAGENLVRTACAVHKYNTAGRTGMGAVMGSKNLKAIAIRGNKKIQIAHPELFKENKKKWRKRIKESPLTQTFSKYGSAGPLAMEDRVGILAIRNFEQCGGFEGIEEVDDKALAKKFFTKSNSCFACPIGCIQSYEVKEGPYKGTRGTKMPEGCTSSCGPTCGNACASSLFKINNLANEYGMDILDFGLTMSIAMDWYENGLIGREDTDGIPLNWGNHESMVKMIPKIARREGFGNLLADGIVKAAQKLGKNAEKYVSSCKGMVFGGVDARALKGAALCWATATRGCDHLRGGVLIEFPRGGKPAIPPEEAIERFGSEEVLTPTSYTKAVAANFYQDVYTIADSLEICKFITAHNGHGITLEDMAEMFYAVTGIKMDTPEMRTIANRIFTLERSFLVREGIDKKDDFLKGKWVKGPVPNGPFEGNTIEEEKWEKMLSEYYQTRGWDPQTGIPTRETLENLGLHDVSQELKKMGKFS